MSASGKVRFDPAIQARAKARKRVVQALYQWQLTQHSAQAIADQFRDEQDFDGCDETFFRDALAAVIREVGSLDEILSRHLDRPLNDVDLMERAVLRFGTWELKECPQTPYRVVLAEAINLARTFGAEGGHSYVNGVLDRVALQLRAVEYGR
jgi:transcription antitermination protein NusB